MTAAPAAAAALSRSRGLRHPGWYSLLLLPVLPLLAQLAGSPSDPGHLAVFAFLLIALGLALALGVPALLDHLGWRARKEAEQLRPAWIASLFLTQFCTLGGSEFSALANVVFGLTACLVAAHSFGVEFQQRTLGALLSQPVGRAHTWSLKSGVLAAALALHFLVLQLSNLAISGSTPFTDPSGLVLGAAVCAFLAWATTPAWTLLTRSLLAGLVFSISAPALGLALIIAFTGNNEPALAVLIALALAYAVAGYQVGRRHWLRCEATDTPLGENPTAFVGSWTWSRATPTAQGTASRTSQRPWRRLWAKELRLQCVTLGMALATLAIGTAAFLAPAATDLAGYLQGLTTIFAAITLLLGPATAIAEERRLGTLDAQVLQPVSLTTQAWIKLAGALTPALLTGLPLAFAYGLPANPTDLALPAAFCAVAFTLTFFASSVSTNALRALLLGLVLCALTGAVTGFTLDLLVPVSTRQVADSLARQLQENPAPWFAEAETHSPDAIARLWQQFASPNDPLASPLAGIALAALLIALPLALARRNLAHPAHAPHRSLRQSTLLILSLLFLGASIALVLTVRAHRYARTRTILEAWEHLRLEEKLSPAQSNLRRHMLKAEVSSIPGIQLRFRTFDSPPTHRSRATPSATPDTDTSTPPAPRWVSRWVGFPLSTDDRTAILEHADIPDALRDALRREAHPDADPSTLPSGRPAGPWPPQTELPVHFLRRYGLPNPGR
jgi:hypothetical protein